MGFKGLLVPDTCSDSLGEVVFACDTSGSMGDATIARCGRVIAHIATQYKPEKVRVLWWDTRVHHQQIFVDDYEDLSKLEKVLDPKGGGGTCAECVPKYMKENAIKPQCVIMLTDGYLDQLVERFNVPTLWVVTHSKTYVPTEGRVVQFEDY